MMPSIKKHIKNQKGFTILELIVVVVILGILALVFFPQIKGREDAARVQATETQMYRLWESARIWRANNGYLNYANFTNIDSLIAAGLITDADKNTAFGTTFSMAKTSDNLGVTITAPITGNNPNANCTSIANRFTQKGYTATCSGSTLTVDFKE